MLRCIMRYKYTSVWKRACGVYSSYKCTQASVHNQPRDPTEKFNSLAKNKYGHPLTQSHKVVMF